MGRYRRPHVVAPSTGVLSLFGEGVSFSLTAIILILSLLLLQMYANAEVFNFLLCFFFIN